MRILIHYVLPLLLPTLIYFSWAWFASGRAERKQEGEETETKAPYPWFWLAVSGFVVLVIVLGVTSYHQGSDPSSTYYPPRFENGKLIPGHFE